MKINLNEVLYIESQRDYLLFHLRDKQVKSIMTIATLEKQLPETHFMRIHRSFIVALDKIAEIERNTVVTVIRD